MTHRNLLDLAPGRKSPAALLARLANPGVIARLIPLLPALAALAPHGAHAGDATALVQPRTMAEIIKESRPTDWRSLDPDNTLYLELAGGRVVIELAPRFAPRNIANIKLLARGHFYDGLTVERVQDDYVTQWGSDSKPLGKAATRVPAEFVTSGRDLAVTPLKDPDTYAPLTGFADGFPVGRDATTGQAWLTHCYGMVGVARDTDADTGNGSELYVVIGQPPRQLDRNITLVGRVVQGMELLSSLPRGPAPMGFYADPRQGARIRRLVVAADVPGREQSRIEELRTDTQTFAELVESRRNHSEDWYKVPAGRVDVCNVPVPVRAAR